MNLLDMRRVSTSDECVRNMVNDDCIKILWTGGWDSTFRVLYATLVDGKRVEPHYIVDTTRQSTLRELEAISEIRDSLRKLDKQAYERLSNLRITIKSEIPDDMAITNSWERLKLRAPLGSQYDWLARYVKALNFVDLELSVHVDDKAHYFLTGNVESIPYGGYRLSRSITGDETIFARFRFPILAYTKIEMSHMANRYGFNAILEKSWFCHTPINRIPCGMCSPCIYTIKEGMGYRLSRKSLLRYHMRRCRLVLQSPSLSSKILLSKVKALW